MGIIISSFPGCGKNYLMNTHGNKAKMVDAVAEFRHYREPTDDTHDYDYNLFVDAMMKDIDKYDIIFLPSDKKYLKVLNERNIDYDLFYPSKERRGEFIENMVRKRMKPQDIMILDRDFDKMIKELDDIEDENCYKHKMSEGGHFIGNDSSIMQYINNLKQTQETNE